MTNKSRRNPRWSIAAFLVTISCFANGQIDDNHAIMERALSLAGLSNISIEYTSDYLEESGSHRREKTGFEFLNGMWRYERINLNTGKKTIVCWDGKLRYYLSEDAATLCLGSKSNPHIDAIIEGLTFDNPLYASFVHFFRGDFSNFAPNELMLASTWAKVISSCKIGRVERAKEGSVLSIETTASSEKIFYTESSLFPNRVEMQHKLSGRTEICEISDYKQAGKELKVLIPSRISRKPFANGLPVWGEITITLDGGVRTLDTKTDSERFKIPLSAAHRVWDCDINAQVR